MLKLMRMKVELSSAPTEVATNKDEVEPMDVDPDEKHGIKRDPGEPEQEAKDTKLIRANEKES